MQIISIKIDDVHELVISQSKETRSRGYGYDKVTEVNIVGPEGPYLKDAKEIHNTKDLALYILHYFDVEPPKMGN